MRETELLLVTLQALFSFLVPVGLALLAVGASEEGEAQETGMTALLALGAAVLGYFACGFAFEFGGVATISHLSGLSGLSAEWSPFDLSLGPGWGLIGLRGFALNGPAYSAEGSALFLANLPRVWSAVMVTLLALRRHLPPLRLLIVGLCVSGVLHPLLGNWMWGGGWLANLGFNLGLGHGFVDMSGSASVFALGALVAAAGHVVLPRQRDKHNGPPRLPPVHFPLFAILGALLCALGWWGLTIPYPMAADNVAGSVAATNLLLGAGASGLAVALYSWFVTARPDAMASSRALVAGLVATGAGAGFIPAWAALVTGAIAGLTSVAFLYIWNEKLKWDDPSASAATYGAPAAWGIIAVGLFAEGRWGTGWNGVGLKQYLGVLGQGVSGMIVPRGFQSAGTLQIQAQLIGLTAAVGLGFFVSLALFRVGRWLTRAWRSSDQSSCPHSPMPEADEGSSAPQESTVESRETTPG